MKLTIIADAEGNIIGTANPRGLKGEELPSRVGVIAEPGQIIHELEVPDDLAEIEAVELHMNYRLDVKAGVARLVDLKRG